MLPSSRVIVASVPANDAPEAACGVPLTGGQVDAQPPVHFDVVEVSGAYQYSVKPLASVSTTPRLVLAVFSVADCELPLDADEGDEAEGAPDDPPPLLPHAAASTATAASPLTIHTRLRIACLHSKWCHGHR